MTDLPVDYSKRPWRSKYLVEETRVLNEWFVFGERADGTVDVADPDGDIFVGVPRAVAEEIIAARSMFCAVILKHFGP